MMTRFGVPCERAADRACRGLIEGGVRLGWHIAATVLEGPRRLGPLWRQDAANRVGALRDAHRAATIAADWGDADG